MMVRINVLFELLDARVLRFDGSCCWSSVQGRSRILVPEFHGVASLCSHRRAGDPTAVLARQKVEEEYVPVGDVGGDDGCREEHEGKDRLPEFDAFRRRHGDDDVEPEIGEDAPRGGDKEDAQVLDLAHLTIGDDGHTEPDDDEEVEGGAADDGAWAEVASVEPVADDLDDGEHDLRSGRAESHQGQVGHRLVPDSNVHHHRLSVCPAVSIITLQSSPSLTSS